MSFLALHLFAQLTKAGKKYKKTNLFVELLNAFIKVFKVLIFFLTKEHPYHCVRGLFESLPEVCVFNVPSNNKN